MSLLSEQLADGQFVVTAEIAPPKGTNLGQAFDEARKLVGVTAVNITDNQGANMRLSSLALAARLQQSGTETILQLTCSAPHRSASRTCCCSPVITASSVTSRTPDRSSTWIRSSCWI